ncbi:MAG TPA: MMPL family transporter [Streptosporangiaceae bacterium]|nr:MMPL family transporter [Streptosporangiaceae bacterium]
MVALWIVLLAGATAGHRALGGVYSDSFSLPGSPSQQGSALLKAHEPGAGGQSGQLVFTVSSGSLAEHQGAIEKAVAQVRDLPHVLSASDPLTGGTASKDGRTAYDVINFDTNPAALGPDYLTPGSRGGHPRPFGRCDRELRRRARAGGPAGAGGRHL